MIAMRYRKPATAEPPPPEDNTGAVTGETETGGSAATGDEDTGG